MGWDISLRDWACEKGCGLRIARNHMGSIFRPNNEYWKRSRKKLRNGVNPGGGDISVHKWERERGCGLEIARNCMGSTFRPNNEYWKRSRAKIIKRALSEGPGY